MIDISAPTVEQNLVSFSIKVSSPQDGRCSVLPCPKGDPMSEGGRRRRGGWVCLYDGRLFFFFSVVLEGTPDDALILMRVALAWRGTASSSSHLLGEWGGGGLGAADNVGAAGGGADNLGWRLWWQARHITLHCIALHYIAIH